MQIQPVRATRNGRYVIDFSEQPNPAPYSTMLSSRDDSPSKKILAQKLRLFLLFFSIVDSWRPRLFFLTQLILSSLSLSAYCMILLQWFCFIFSVSVFLTRSHVFPPPPMFFFSPWDNRLYIRQERMISPFSNLLENVFLFFIRIFDRECSYSAKRKLIHGGVWVNIF